jgi:hypothetical protein
MSELRECPFCGGEPSIETIGSCIDIECCVSLSIQKSDYLTMEERNSWDNDKAVLAPEVENKVLKIAIDLWNHRPTESKLQQRVRELEEWIGNIHHTCTHHPHLQCMGCEGQKLLTGKGE